MKQRILNKIIEAIQEKKGEEIVVIDLSKGEGTITDYFVICNATSDRHAKAIADWIMRFVRKTTKEHVWKVDGYEEGNWIVLDYVDIIVHIFLPQYREYYRLEDIWGDFPMEEIKELVSL